jgi:hypothetical protein
MIEKTEKKEIAGEIATVNANNFLRGGGGGWELMSNGYR